jgi:hypothetical protein
MDTDTSAGTRAPSGPVPTAIARQPASGRGWRFTGWHVPASWPLLPVLLVQAVLSLRLVRADTAFQDEALFLWAGHLQWAHWLHGTLLPPFPYYFSGAPVIYPPLGALADSVGGLAGARVLSLVFMLGATALLWSTTRRLFGRRSAFFAAALFAVLGPVLELGALATIGALSVFFVALAAWLAMRSGTAGGVRARMVLAGVALGLANATRYSTLLFDVFVPVLAVLAVLPTVGIRIALRRAAILVGTLAAFLAVSLLLGGSSYLSGFQRTDLVPEAHTDSPLSVVSHSWYWAGLLVVLAIGGVVLSCLHREPRSRIWLLAVLAVAVVFGTAEQGWMHTTAVLNQHVGLGAWFTAVAAGYAVDRFIAAAPAGREQALTSVFCVAALVFPVWLGAAQSWAMATSWPNATSFTSIFGPLADHGHGRLLVEDPAIAEYYLKSGSQWQRWSSTRNIVLPGGASTGSPAATSSITAAGNPAAFARYISMGYFSYVALNFTDTTALDHGLATLLHRNPDYHTIQVVPYGFEVKPIGQGTYVIWKYEPRS